LDGAYLSEIDVNIGPLTSAGVACGMDDTPSFKRLSFKMDHHQFAIPSFTHKQLARLNGQSNGVVLLGHASVSHDTVQLTNDSHGQVII
jgi:hypothetical protein